MLRPTYSEGFRCIGPECEDTCCAGWAVQIDQATYEKYQTIPTGSLRTLIDASVLPVTEDPSPAHFASVRLLPSQECPFHTAERLCQIQVEHGEGFLSKTCTNYPRVEHTIDELQEKALMLSCPEAARIVLNNRELLAAKAKRTYHLTWDDNATGAADMRFYFWPIREFAIGLLRNRAYPLWQRMFLLGTFSRRLDAIARGELERGFPAFLRDFSAAIGSGSLRYAMNGIPADPALQLEMVLRLVQFRVNGANLAPRLIETLTAFTQGIGHGQNVPLENQIAHYAAVYREHYFPFFQKHPHMLENYLINMVFRGLFPFGNHLCDSSQPLDIAKAFSSLAIQFSLIKGLLIGVAGHYKQSFAAGHVVQTVQTVVKHFDHNPEFLVQAQLLLTSKNLDNVHGITMLLRN
jgi:lysine-N-methylase